MLAKRIIPCLDVSEGRVYKGIRFKELKDVGDPPELATFYEKQGADEIVFLDITASSGNRKTMLDVVEKTANNLFIPLTVGGGLRSKEDVRDTLVAGADKVSLNTAAVLREELITECSREFGEQCIVVAIDAKREGTGWKVYTHGGRNRTDMDAVEWAVRCQKLGAGEILLTSMDRDGTKDGYDNELNRAISESVHIPIIASGGCGTIEHIYDTLTEGKSDAALAASIFHYGTHTVADVKKKLTEMGVLVR